MEQAIVLSMSSALTIVGGFGVILGIFYKLICNKFEKIDEKIGENTKAINELKTGQAVMGNELKNINQRLINIEKHIRPPKIESFPTHSHDEPKEN